MFMTVSSRYVDIYYVVLATTTPWQPPKRSTSGSSFSYILYIPLAMSIRRQRRSFLPSLMMSYQTGMHNLAPAAHSVLHQYFPRRRFCIYIDIGILLTDLSGDCFFLRIEYSCRIFFTLDRDYDSAGSVPVVMVCLPNNHCWTEECFLTEDYKKSHSQSDKPNNNDDQSGKSDNDAENLDDLLARYRKRLVFARDPSLVWLSIGSLAVISPRPHVHISVWGGWLR